MLRTTTKILRGFSQKPSFNKIISRPYYRRAMESLLQPKPKTLTPEISNKPRASFSVASAIGTAFAGSMFAGTGWLLYHYGFREREIPITGCYVDLTKNDHNGLILSNKKFKKVGEKVKGELSGAVLQNIDSNKNFLEKGAMNHASLIVEVVIADFLNMVRPGEQPASLIMEEMQDSGIARFFTLSEIYPDSMDLEDFVLNKNWREEFSRVPVVGLGESIAAKLAFGTEIKLANLLITKVKNAEGQERYVISAIDHEILGEDYFITKKFTTDPASLIYELRDFHPFDPDDPSAKKLPLMDTEKGLEFKNYLLTQGIIKSEDVVEFYKKMIEVSPRKIDKVMTALDGGNGVMTDSEHHKFKSMIDEAQRHARQFLLDNNHIEESQAGRPKHACSC